MFPRSFNPPSSSGESMDQHGSHRVQKVESASVVALIASAEAPTPADYRREHIGSVHAGRTDVHGAPRGCATNPSVDGCSNDGRLPSLAAFPYPVYDDWAEKQREHSTKHCSHVNVGP